jgi:hypothetical protein
MTESFIRFGVIDGQGHRASSWKCWAEIKSAKNEVYLACRKLGGVVKASFHESGSWHIAFDSKAFPSLFEGTDRPSSRFATKWSRPPELSPGVVLACRILVPWYAPTVPEPTLDPKVTWIQTAPHDKALEFAVIFTSPTTPVTDWPARRSMKTELVGQLTLGSGDRVWIVYHIVDWVDPPPVTGKPRFGKGRSAEDLQGAGLRALAWRQEPDGSILFCDAPVRARREPIDS